MLETMKEPLFKAMLLSVYTNILDVQRLQKTHLIGGRLDGDMATRLFNSILYPERPLPPVIKANANRVRVSVERR